MILRQLQKTFLDPPSSPCLLFPLMGERHPIDGGLFWMRAFITLTGQFTICQLAIGLALGDGSISRSNISWGSDPIEKIQQLAIKYLTRGENPRLRWCASLPQSINQLICHSFYGILFLLLLLLLAFSVCISDCIASSFFTQPTVYPLVSLFLIN